MNNLRRPDINSYQRPDINSSNRHTNINGNSNRPDINQYERPNINNASTSSSDSIFFPARCPGGGSSDYIGNNSNIIRHSSSQIIVSTDSNDFPNSSRIVISSDKFKSSDDILYYLKHHPDFQKVPQSQLNAIMAAVLSGLLIVGGVVLIIVSGGTATLGVVLATSLLMGSGISGMVNSVSGAINRNFEWGNFAKEIGINAGLTLITFGAGYGAGNLMGMALVGTKLTENAIKAISTVAGAIAGSGARSGAYVIITTIKGEEISALSLSLEGVFGAIEGGFAGYLGAKAAILKGKLPVGEKLISLKDGNQKTQVYRSRFNSAPDITDAPLIEEALGNPFRRSSAPELLNLRIGTQDEVLKGISYSKPGVKTLKMLRGYHTEAAFFNPKTGLLEARGAGFIHIIKRHPDIGKLLGFTQLEVNIVLGEEILQEGINRGSLIQRMTNKLCEVLDNPPCGITVGEKSGGFPVWRAFNAEGKEKFIKAVISNEPWRSLNDEGAHVIVQLNRVEKRHFKLF